MTLPHPVRAWRRSVAVALGAIGVGLGLGPMASAQPAGAPAVVELDSAGVAMRTAERASLRVPPSPERKLVFPLDPGPDCYVLDNYGQDRGGGRLHEGIDIMGSAGRPVYAVASGTLTRRFSNTGTAGWGWTITDPVTKVSYRYFHLTEDPAGRTLGDRVSIGDVIGYVGSSGTSSDENVHLHFEVRPDDRPTNPLPLVQIPPTCRVSPPIR